MSATARIEYGRMIDCTLNGCKKPHSDDGEVYAWTGFQPPLPDPDLDDPPFVNGHACRWVQREISEWHLVSAQVCGPEDR